MSRDALRDFVHAIEHDQLLRMKAAGCKTDQELLNLAQRHGFSLQSIDLVEDNEASRIGSWFELSRISPRRL